MFKHFIKATDPKHELSKNNNEIKETVENTFNNKINASISITPPALKIQLKLFPFVPMEKFLWEDKQSPLKKAWRDSMTNT